MTTKKLKAEDTLSDVDYILCIVLIDNTLRFSGQGLKFRNNPLHPRGWRKLTTAQEYAKQAEIIWKDWNFRFKEIRVCERFSNFRCLSSYAITKQDLTITKEQNHVTT